MLLEMVRNEKLADEQRQYHNNRIEELRKELAAANKELRSAKSALNRAKNAALDTPELNKLWGRVQAAYDAAAAAKASWRKALQEKENFIDNIKRELKITEVETYLGNEAVNAIYLVLEKGTGNPAIIDAAMTAAGPKAKFVEEVIDRLHEKEASLEEREKAANEAGTNYHHALKTYGDVRKAAIQKADLKKLYRNLRWAEEKVQRLVNEIKKEKQLLQ